MRTHAHTSTAALTCSTDARWSSSASLAVMPRMICMAEGARPRWLAAASTADTEGSSTCVCNTAYEHVGGLSVSAHAHAAVHAGTRVRVVHGAHKCSKVCGTQGLGRPLCGDDMTPPPPACFLRVPGRGGLCGSFGRGCGVGGARGRGSCVCAGRCEGSAELRQAPA